MSTRQKSLRFGIALCAIITISSLAFAASTWTDVLTLVPFGSASTSVDDGSENPEPVVEPRRVEGRRVDMGETSMMVPLIGTYNIPGDYSDLNAAITDLNLQGVGGAVTLNVLAGNPQTSPAGGYVVGGTGSLVLSTTSMTNTVTIQGNGNTVTASAAHTVGALNDGIFKLIGADWITISGFVMNEDPANIVTAAATNTMTEWGVALLYVALTDGAQNNTITGNTIDLNRTYQNTFGIYANATHSATAPSTSATATGAAGGNSGLTITANNITDVNQGIVVVGPTAAADHNDGLVIGGSAPNANTITNYGTTGTFSSYANVSGTVYGILVRNTKNFGVSFNNITSSSGASGVTAGTLRGIYVPSASIQPTGTFTNNINNNTLAVTSHVVAGTLQGITVESTTSSPTSTTNINNNNFITLNHTIAAATGAITAISHVGSSTAGPLHHSISNNTFTNITSSSTGSFTFIGNSWARPTSGVGTINNNSIVTAFNKTGAGGTVTLYNSNSTSGATISEINTGNNFSNITVTGATIIAGWASTDGGSPSKTVTGNTISNITGGTSAITGLSVSFSGSSNVSNNTVSSISCACAITGIASSSGAETFSQNTIHTLASSGASAVTGISNTAGTTKTYSRNKIYNLENTNAGGSVLGFTVSGATASLTTNIHNNLIGDLRAPVGSNASIDVIRGLNLISTGTTSTINASYNTIYLNATSSGASFLTAGVFHSASAIATTATLNLRNNIIVNTSGGGASPNTAAYRRSVGTAGTLANYGSASNSNLFYAGTPGATNLIYSDGTSTAQTLAAYKNGIFTAGTISPRDASSISENPPFMSTTGSSPSFLHISSMTPTQIEGGGIPVTGITDDYDGETRNAGTPDIGADEFTGIALDMNGPNIAYTTLGNTSLTTNRVLNATIVDASGVAGGAFAPRIYFRKNAGSYFSIQCGAPTGNVYPCTIDYSLVGGAAPSDVFDYFVVAQDTLGNVSANPGGGFSATNVNTVTTPPTTPNTYTITGTVSGTKTVGVGGDYATLTAAVAALNNNDINGPVTLTLIDANYAEAVPFTINANNGSSASNTVTIKPAAGVAPTISGSSASCIINFNGADYMTIDGSNAVGGTTRDLTITNTSTGTTSAVVCMTSLGVGAGATNNTVKNTNLVGSTLTATNGTLFGVFSGSSTISTSSNGADNDTNTVQNNNITKTQIGIYSAGESSANKNVGTVISQNVMNAPSPNNLNNGGIYVRFDSGATISQNEISVLRHNGTAGLTGTAFGIALGVIPSNTFLAFTGADVTGATVTRNRIGPVTQLNATGYSAFGVVINSVTSATTLVANNMVSEVVAASTASDFSAGILAGGGTGSTTEVYFNSVSMTGSRNSADYPSYGLAINTGDPIVNVRDNVFLNTQTSTDLGLSYAIGTGSDTFANFTSNYNNFFVSGAGAFVGRTGGIGPLLGTDQATLANWQTAVSDDANSQSVDPLFVSTTDLHLQGTSPILDDGTPIAGVTVDFDGDMRSATTPDIGADEIGAPVGGPEIQTSPPSLAFGNQQVGTSSAALQVTIDNIGTANLDLGNILSGNAAFTIQNSPANTTVLPGGQVVFTVTFSPASQGAFNTNLTILSNDADEGAVNIPMSGTGTTPEINLTGNSVSIPDGDMTPSPADHTDFGSTAVTGGSVVRTFTIENTGTASLTASLPTEGSASFSVAGTGFPAVIAPGGTKTFNVMFDPTAAGLHTATISIVNSDADEDPYDFAIQGTGVEGGTLALSSATYGVGENVGMATITVTRTGGTNGAVGISYGTSNGTATGGASCTAGIDYVTASGTLSWADGESTSKTFNISVCDDSLFESDETVNAAITTPTGGATLGTPNTAVLTVSDNDTAPTLQFSSATYSNNDDLANGLEKTDELSPEVATITVTRTGATENAVSVNYATVAGGSATAGASCTADVDYVSTNGTLNFAAGVAMQTFNVTVCSDALFEGDETVNLALSAPSPPAVLGTPNTAVLTLVDNETVPTLQFSSATYMNSDDLSSLGETTDEFAPGVATITVTRTGATGNAVSVNYATMAGGTATGGASCTAGVDYVSTNGTLNFAATETMKTFNVTVCTDLLFEGNETVNLVLSSPSAPATLGMPNSAVLTIVDNETVPTLQFSSATYTIGEAGPSATITVTRTGASDNAVSVNYGTTNGTATGGVSCGVVDYVTTSGTLNFVAGDNSETFTVPICDDAESEGDETVNLTLTGPTMPAVLGMPNTAVLTITDNDGSPSVQFSTATDSVSEAGGTITMTVTRTGATGNAVSVNYATGGITATSGVGCTAGVDFIGVNGTLNFAAGVTMQSFNVTICNDTLFESSEQFSASLSMPGGGAVIGMPSTETVTITNDDPAPTVSIGDASLSEGNAGTSNTAFTISLSAVSGQTVSVNWATANGTATVADLDYTVSSGTAIISAGSPSVQVFVPIIGDTKFEADETFVVNLSNPANATINDGQGQGTITNDDIPPALSINDVSQIEGNAGSSNFTFTVSLSAASGVTATVNYATSNGTATAGSDYAAVAPSPVSFNPGETSKQVIILVNGDTMFEANETFNVNLSSPSNASIADGLGVGTIINDDAAPTLSINDVSVTEGAGGTVNASFTVSLSAASGFLTTVDYATANGTATTADNDYVATSGTANIPAGATSTVINVTVNGDLRFELNETFFVNLSGGSGYTVAGSDLQGQGTITNDDVVPSLSIDDVTLTEGNSGTKNFTFTVTLSMQSGTTTSVNWATADGTATAGSDYASASGSVIIPPGGLTGTATVVVNGDTTVEPNETFFVNLTSPVNAIVSDGQGVGTITNDDSSVQFAQATYSFGEGAGTVNVTVTRTGSSMGAVTANYGFVPGTANGAAICGAGVDYAAVAGALNWADGDTASKNISIAICEDALAEGSENFVVEFAGVTGATAGSPTSTTVTITDNDGDVIAPVISYTPIPNDPMATALSANITDAVGVTAATVFWRIDGGMYTSAPCMLSGGTAQNGTWSCTIGGVMNPSAVSYYVTATDAVMNTGSNPVGGAIAPNLFTVGAATIQAGVYRNANLGNGVLLGGDVLIEESLTLNGVIDTGANKLSLACNVPVMGGGESGYVVGSLERFFCGVETFTFHVGGPFPLPPISPEGIASNYSPLTVSISAGIAGSSLTVKVFDTHLAGFDPARSISRNWSIEESGSLTASLAFTYRNEDVNGNESDYRVYRYPGGGGLITNLCPMAPCVNTATNTASVSNVSDFSRWTIAELLVPTAASVSLSGRVVDSSGRGIRNAVLTLEGGGLPAPRTALTSTFGYYTFDGLAIGTYIVTINSKRYTFTVPTRTVAMAEDVADVDFVAEPLE